MEEVGETTLCDQVKVELLSLTWLFGAHHLCGEPLFITQWLKTFLAYGSEFHPSLLFISSGTLSKLLHPGVTDWPPVWFGLDHRSSSVEKFHSEVQVSRFS